MTTYINLNSICILEQALSPKYRQSSQIFEAANHAEVHTRIHARAVANADDESRQINVWLHEMFPEWWPEPQPWFNQQVAAIREDVHIKARNRGYTYLEEIHMFFLDLQPLVERVLVDDVRRRHQGSMSGVGAGAHDHGMALNPDRDAQTRVQIEEMDIETDENEGTLYLRSIQRAVRGIVSSRTLPPGQRGPRKKVLRRRVEGDCSICLNPLRYCKSCMPDDDCTRGLSAESDFQHGNEDNIDHDAGLPDHLVWCKAFCGINYHAECFEGWVDQFKSMRRVSCPSCRRRWQD